MTLWDSDPAATPFHTPDYATAAWETELGVDRTFHQIQVRDGGALRGLANVTVDPDRTLRFLGNASVTDYLGPLSARPDRDQVADLLIEGIGRIEGWTAVELLGLAEDAGWVEPIVAALGRRGSLATVSPLDVCPRVDLTGGLDAYLERLPSKLRHEFKRKERRLERETGGYTIRMSTADTLAADLETFYAMHRASDGQKGHFLYDEMAVLFTRMAEAFLQRDWLRLSWLDVGGEPWAAVLTFAAKGVWNVYNSAYDHTKRDLGPGMVLMGESIRMAATEGAQVFDLLRGDEPYKYRFGAVDVAVMQMVAPRESTGDLPALPSEPAVSKGA